MLGCSTRIQGVTKIEGTNLNLVKVSDWMWRRSDVDQCSQARDGSQEDCLSGRVLHAYHAYHQPTHHFSCGKRDQWCWRRENQTETETSNISVWYLLHCKFCHFRFLRGNLYKIWQISKIYSPSRNDVKIIVKWVSWGQFEHFWALTNGTLLHHGSSIASLEKTLTGVGRKANPWKLHPNVPLPSEDDLASTFKGAITTNLSPFVFPQCYLLQSKARLSQ